MNAIRLVTGSTDPAAFATTATMALEHIGSLLGFMEKRLGELAIFDPDAHVKEATLREAIQVGSLVCKTLVQDGRACGVQPEVARDLWEALVEEAVRRNAGQQG